MIHQEDGLMLLIFTGMEGKLEAKEVQEAMKVPGRFQVAILDALDAR